MRFRLYLLFLLTAGLAACEKTQAPLRLDFVGSTSLTSGNRTVAAADSTRTHVYAEADADAPELQRLRITVTYSPNPAPIVYPNVLSTYNTSATPSGQRW